MAEALDGCGGVVHSAAVVTMQATRAREMLETNARGVDAVVGGAVRAGTPSVVYVSSIGALFRPGGPALTPDSPVVPGSNAYGKSKAQGEEAVRRWQAEGAPIQITYPTAVVGPDDPGLSESNHALRTFLGTTMVMTSSGFQLVDVRDLARVQARLVEQTEGPGRYLVAGRFFRWAELADELDELTGLRVRRLPAPGPLLRMGGIVGDFVKRFWPFDFPLTREATDFATRWRPVDDSATTDGLGLKYRDVRETLAETLRWMVGAGHLEPSAVGRLWHDAVRKDR